MSPILSKVRKLIAEGNFRVSVHALRELENDDLLIGPLISGVEFSTIVEEYPDYHKGPCVLVLQTDERARPIHLLWGIPAGAELPAVLITAYVPDQERWTDDFTRRRPL
jgi:hypothetical protein